MVICSSNLVLLQGNILQIWRKKNKQLLLPRIQDYLHLEPALVSGLASAGMHVYTLGPLPTNGLAMLTKMNANLGIMITASHNPYYDNGLKLFGPDGLKPLIK